jgi:hypothetical protein
MMEAKHCGGWSDGSGEEEKVIEGEVVKKGEEKVNEGEVMKKGEEEKVSEGEMLQKGEEEKVSEEEMVQQGEEEKVSEGEVVKKEPLEINEVMDQGPEKEEKEKELVGADVNEEERVDAAKDSVFEGPFLEEPEINEQTNETVDEIKMSESSKKELKLPNLPLTLIDPESVDLLNEGEKRDDGVERDIEALPQSAVASVGPFFDTVQRKTSSSLASTPQPVQSFIPSNIVPFKSYHMLSSSFIQSFPKTLQIASVDSVFSSTACPPSSLVAQKSPRRLSSVPNVDQYALAHADHLIVPVTPLSFSPHLTGAVGLIGIFGYVKMH